MKSNYIPKILERTQFGNLILQKVSKSLKPNEIKSEFTQHLIADMSHTLLSKCYGVGLAAPQIGRSLSISVIDISPKSKNHNISESFRQVIINPEILEVIGKKQPMWEGCLSFGSKNSPVFAQTMRYKQIKVKFYDENAKIHTITLTGLPAHVFQHEVDHLNGILFPERVEDHSTWMNAIEYKKMKSLVNKQK